MTIKGWNHKSIVLALILAATASQACVEATIYTDVGRNLVIVVQRAGAPLSSAWVKLIKHNGAATEEFLGPYVTNRNGLVTVPDVPEGYYEARYEFLGIPVGHYLRVVTQPNASKESMVTLDWPARTILTTRKVRGTLDYRFRSFGQERYFPIANAALSFREVRTPKSSDGFVSNGIGEFNSSRDMAPGFYVAEIDAQIPSQDKPQLVKFIIPLKVDSSSDKQFLPIQLDVKECYGPDYSLKTDRPNAQAH
jgi:hypothetical protein